MDPEDLQSEKPAKHAAVISETERPSFASPVQHPVNQVDEPAPSHPAALAKAKLDAASLLGFWANPSTQATASKTDKEEAIRLNNLRPYLPLMQKLAVDKALQARLKQSGLTLTPELLASIAMQETGSFNNPAQQKATNGDGGLGIMQITPYHGKLDADVAAAIGWDNEQGVPYNEEHSNWRDPEANLRAGILTLAIKAERLKSHDPTAWDKMSEQERTQAAVLGYNRGEVGAEAAIKDGSVAQSGYVQSVQSHKDYLQTHNPFTKLSKTAPLSNADERAKERDGKPMRMWEK